MIRLNPRPELPSRFPTGDSQINIETLCGIYSCSDDLWSDVYSDERRPGDTTISVGYTLTV